MALTEVRQYRSDSPYRILYTRPGSDVVVTSGHADLPVRSSSKVRKYVVEPPKQATTSIIEVEDIPKPTQKTSTTVTKVTSKNDTLTDVATSTATVKKTMTTMTDTLTTSIQRTSSKAGTLYFAYGSDMSPSQLRTKAELDFDSSSRPIALARLKGWQWIISAKGVPNVLRLCEPGIYSDKGSVRMRHRQTDSSMVYGLIYNLHFDDENKVDRRRGYKEHGPINTDLDLEEVAKRPFLQGDNTVNKLYEKVEIVEWFCSPLNEGINILRDPMNVKCLMYADESPRGTRSGRIWDDVIDKVAEGVTVAVRKYGMPRRWVDNVMSQHEIYVFRDTSKQSRSRSRVTKETRFDLVKYDGRDVKPRRPESDYESDEDDIVETRITKRITEGYMPAPVPQSDFYREKRGRARRYISL